MPVDIVAVVALITAMGSVLVQVIKQLKDKCKIRCVCGSDGGGGNSAGVAEVINEIKQLEQRIEVNGVNLP